MQQVVERVTQLDLEAHSGFEWLPFGKLELQIYSIRHLQQHTGELMERLKPTKSLIPSPSMCVRRPAVLAEIAWKRYQKGDVDNPAMLKPIYLHHGEPIPQ